MCVARSYRLIQTPIKTESEDFTKGSNTRDKKFNADEAEVNFKILTRMSLTSKHEKFATGFKSTNKEMIVLACGNISGPHRLQLMCIEKSEKPRAYKNI